MSLSARTNHRVFRRPVPPGLFARRITRRGPYPPPTHDKVYRQTHRVADDSLARHELYVGEDKMPDFDASSQPVQTSTSLPFTWTPTPPGSGTLKLYAVTRERNKYGLLSFNQHPTIIEIDTAGDEVLGPLTDPEILSVVDGDSGEIIVTARYPRGVDRDEADKWDLYVENGVDPVPGSDTPVATADFGWPMVDHKWRIAEDSLTPGDTYHVMVVVRRDGDGTGEIGQSTVTQHVAADTYDIDADDTTLFGGNEYELGL